MYDIYTELLCFKKRNKEGVFLIFEMFVFGYFITSLVKEKHILQKVLIKEKDKMDRKEQKIQ